MDTTTSRARDVAYQLHPFTNLGRHETEGPLVISSGKGVYVSDESGREYLEAMAGLWCTSLGFGDTRLAEAASRQLHRLPYYHQFGGKANDVAITLAERIVKLMPVPMSKVFFNNSGSEANESAVKLVWYYNNARGRHRKKKIISRQRAYHGTTMVAASLTGLPASHRDFDLPIPQVRHTDCPYWYRYGHAGESEEHFATRLAENLDLLIQREDPDTVAAMIAEPVMGAGGVLVPPKTYFEKVQAVLKKHDVLLIADEVICGFGRTGNMFGSETFRLQPDIMTMAKALSSAYLPISALLINEKLYRAIRDNSGKLGTFGHGYTYSGHPVSAAVAVETLKIYEERDILSQVRRVTPTFQSGLRKLGEHPLAGEVRGIGLIGGIELVKNKKTKESFDPKLAVGPYAVKCAQEHGLITRSLGDTLAFCPPLIINEAQIGDMLARYGKAFDDTYAWLRQQGLLAA